MGKSSYHDDKTVCWVYISATGRKKYRIGYTLTTPDDAPETGAGTVVWQRSFQGVANAIAYKLFLESVSLNALENIIKRGSAGNKDN